MQETLSIKMFPFLLHFLYHGFYAYMTSNTKVNTPNSSLTNGQPQRKKTIFHQIRANKCSIASCIDCFIGEFIHGVSNLLMIFQDVNHASYYFLECSLSHSSYVTWKEHVNMHWIPLYMKVCTTY
jgi:hypothetical protein